LGYAIALVVVTAGGLTRVTAVQPCHFRRHSPLHEQAPRAGSRHWRAWSWSWRWRGSASLPFFHCGASSC
jgi:hypothetical protein